MQERWHMEGHTLKLTLLDEKPWGKWRVCSVTQPSVEYICLCFDPRQTLTKGEHAISTQKSPSRPVEPNPRPSCTTVLPLQLQQTLIIDSFTIHFHSNVIYSLI